MTQLIITNQHIIIIIIIVIIKNWRKKEEGDMGVYFFYKPHNQFLYDSSKSSNLLRLM